MTIVTVTSQAFKEDTSTAKKAAQRGPVFITDHGQPTHVLMMIDEYRRLSGADLSLAEAVAHEGTDFDFEPPRLRGGLFRPADLG
jgi:prevent-host-death family protein